MKPHCYIPLFFFFLFFIVKGWNETAFAQVNIYKGGNGDGGSGKENTSYLAPCSWSAAPPAYTNIAQGGSGDGNSSKANTSYISSCPWNAPPPAYTNIATGGSSDGSSMKANTTYIASCPWNAAPPAYSNIAQGGNSDGHSMKANTTYITSCPWNAAPPAYSNIAMGGNTDGNCQDTARCQSYAPFCSVVASAGPDRTICIYDSTTLSGSGGTIYSWTPTTGLSNPNIAAPKASPAVTTTYTVTVGDGVCSRTDSTVVTVNIILPVADAGTNQTICRYDSAQIGAAPVGGNTYLWTPATGLSSATVSNPKASPASTTTYTLTETITATGCLKSNTVTVTVNPAPAAAVGVDKIICNGQSTSIGAVPVGGNTYSWAPTTGLSSSTVANPTANPTSTTIYTLTETITATGCQYSNSVTVTVNPLPAADVTAVCGSDSIQLGTAPTGGNTYSWAPASGLSSSTIANPKAAPATTTTYTLTETITATGCVKANTVTVPGAPTGSDKTICYGQSTTIGAAAVGGSSYSWNPATGLSSSTAANPTASPTATTVYTLTETIIATGCSKPRSVTVTVNPLPVADVGTDKTICRYDSVQIGVAAVGGNTYSWSPSSGLSSATDANPKASPSSTTTYTLTETITATGCQKSNAVAVTVIQPAVISGTSTICVTGSTTLTASGGGASPSYLWTPGGSMVSSITVSPATTTTYSVTITDALCSTSDDQIVTVNPLPNANTGNNQTICFGDSAQLGAAAVGGNTYSWSPATGLSSTTAANPKASPASTTTYTLTETITATGCQKSNSVIVTVQAAASISGTSTICAGGSTTLTASGGGMSPTYSWNTGATTQSITVSPGSTTTYSVTIVECSSTANKTVTVNPLPAANTGSEQIICRGSSTSIGAAPVGGNTYSWAPSTGLSSATVANPTANPTTTTTYTLTETVTATGCQKSNTVKVNVIQPAAVDATLWTICPGQSTILTGTGGFSGGQSYLWSTGATTASITVSPASTTSYSVTVTDAYCSTSDTKTVTVVGSCASVNIALGGSADGNSASTNSTYITSCPWSASPPAYTNIASGGVSDGHSMKENTTYLASCAWSASPPAYSNVGMGGISDGHSMKANISYLGACGWDAPPPTYTNVNMGGNADGQSMRANTTYLGSCPWELPPAATTNIARGGSDDGCSQFDPQGCFAYNPLPVELLFFNAVLKESTSVLCEWVTVSEINNDYFTVEKTTDAVNFKTLAVVKGAGNSKKTLYYSVVDEHPFTGTSYYRLKQTDFNGQYDYSNLVPVTIKSTAFAIKTFPNPVEDKLKAVIYSDKPMDVDISIHDVIGKKVFFEKFSLEKGGNELHIDASAFDDGVYFINLRNGETQQILLVTQFIKLNKE